MPYTILHISDLHRSPQDPIGNEALLSSLVSDLDRAKEEDPPIPNPNAIVVSGDVVQGASLLNPDHAKLVKDQYAVAAELLNMLAERFLDGDRSRVVVVPGNHDVDWNTAYSSMEPVNDADLSTNIRPTTFGPMTDLRWSWKQRKAYRIINQALYDRRLSHYWDFINQFYDGASLAYSIDASSDYSLFELFDGRIGIAAFSSCYGNDCFAYHGAISEQALAQAHMDLRDRLPKYQLMMAVWHHNIEGPPGAADYMDVATIYNMIGLGFRLGLHGHQHRAQATNRFVHLPQQEPMAIISAGSLCAGPVELPTGVNRQYNVIEISDDCSKVRVHVREMVVARVFAPARRAEFGGESYVDMTLGRPAVVGPPGRARNDALILDAEQTLARGDPHRALELLRGVDISWGSYARTLVIKAAIDAQDWAAAVTVLSPPKSIDELVSLISSLVELKGFDEAETALEKYGTSLNLQSATRTDMLQYVAAKRRLT
jgi:hypothetical protein